MKRVGIVGCGNIAHVHAAVLCKLTDVELLGFADCQLDKAKEYVQKYGMEESRSYTSLEAMLQDMPLDVIHICSPHYLHVPMAQCALQRGLDVLMEKPPAISKEEFELLSEAQKTSGKQIGICFQNRYNKTTLMAEELRQDNKIGDLVGARAFVTWHREQTYYKQNEWRGKKSTEGGGVLINQAIHTLDLLVHFFGKPRSVEASVWNRSLKNYIEVEDTVEASIQFEKANAIFYATNAYIVDAPIILELVGVKGRIRIEGQEVSVYYNDGGFARYSWSDKQAAGKSYWGNSHEACIADFYQSLESGIQYCNDLASTEDTFNLVMDIYEAAKGKTVCRT